MFIGKLNEKEDANMSDKIDHVDMTIDYEVGSFNKSTEDRIGIINPMSEEEKKHKAMYFESMKSSVLERRTRIGQIMVGYMTGEFCMVIGDKSLWGYTDIVRMNEEILMGIKKTNNGYIKEFVRYDNYKSAPHRVKDIYVDWRTEAMKSMKGVLSIAVFSKKFGVNYRRGGFYIRCEKNASLKDCVEVYIGLDARCGYKSNADREYVGLYHTMLDMWVLPPTFSKIRVKDGFISATNEVGYGVSRFMAQEQLYYINNNVAQLIIKSGFHHFVRINDSIILAMVTNEKGKKKYKEFRKVSEDTINDYTKKDGKKSKAKKATKKKAKESNEEHDEHSDQTIGAYRATEVDREELFMWVEHSEYNDIWFSSDDTFELVKIDGTKVVANRDTYESDTSTDEGDANGETSLL